MVYLPLLEEMRELYRNNLQTYVREHPGEFLLLESGRDGIEVSFYKTQNDFDKATKKYEGSIGSTFFAEQIPVKTHRFKKGKETLQFIDDYITCCPNDGLTELVVEGGVVKNSCGEAYTYQEIANCPDCGYQVFRKPSDETIRKFEENMDTIII